jgi:glycosyltransferase involved in cell wall biosynthesis
MTAFPDISVNWMRQDYRDQIPFERMPDIYNSHDLYIHIAHNEGTPNPVFEAASCGLPIISNDVGCVSQLLEQDYVEGNVDEFIRKILILYHDRGLGKEVGAWNRKKIVLDWSWEQRAVEYIDFLRR